ncbi:MAG: hypothetical protein WCV62_04050 [Candidatus Peribacteraceae bacterium]|jgi:hypothetical protein
MVQWFFVLVLGAAFIAGFVFFGEGAGEWRRWWHKAEAALGVLLITASGFCLWKSVCASREEGWVFTGFILPCAVGACVGFGIVWIWNRLDILLRGN